MGFGNSFIDHLEKKYVEGNESKDCIFSFKPRVVYSKSIPKDDLA